MKNIMLYVLMLIGMFILSDFLINVGLNSTYKNIERKDDNFELANVYQADATYVNGRIRGTIRDKSEAKKYLSVELYTKRDNLVGRKYIEIDKNDDIQPFEILFKAKDVDYYKISTVDEKQEGLELEIVPKELTKSEIILATVVTFLVFWG